MKKETILIVDDDPKVVRLVTNILEAVGYRVIFSGDGQTALETVGLENPDLILLDIVLPRLDGFEVCRQLRTFSSQPVIMLTSKAQEADKIKGFDLGADDYLTKPFSAKELMARIKAVLKRCGGIREKEPQLTAYGDLTIDPARRKVKLKNQEVKLTPTEFKLLNYLAGHADKVIQHEDLLSEIWGAEYRNDIDYLRTYIKNLRHKIGDDSTHPRYIKTISGVGYTFTPVGASGS